MKAELLHIGELEIRPREGLALAGGEVVPLSIRELAVLVALAERAGRIVPRTELYELVWGGTLRRGDRSVDVYVHKLRSKLQSTAPGSVLIHTHVGFGYRLDPSPSHAFHTATTVR